MPGKVIVLEGADGSGKSTQFSLLTQRLSDEGVSFRRLVYPQYSQPSSALVRMYLGGEFGSKPEDVNAYAASTFFAVDRIASYMKDWREYYLGGGLLHADRYTTSNAVYQGAKAENADDFLKWLFEFEYDLLGLPRPDMVIYLEMPVDVSEKLMVKRRRDTGEKADIHESDREYLCSCRETAQKLVDKYGWRMVHCAHGGEIRTPEDIHEEIYRIIRNEVL